MHKSSVPAHHMIDRNHTLKLRADEMALFWVQTACLPKELNRVNLSPDPRTTDALLACRAHDTAWYYNVTGSIWKSAMGWQNHRPMPH